VQLFSWIGQIAFVVVSLIVGLRLLDRWRRSGALPELAVGTSLLAIGPLGYVPGGFGLALLDQGRIEGALILGWSNLMLNAGMSFAAFFAAGVFRPESRWARAVAVAIAGGLLFTWGSIALTGGFDYRTGLPPAFYVANLLRAVALGWVAGEALLYWRLLRRRGALGLADPVATASVGLWGLGIGAGAPTPLLTMAALHAAPGQEMGAGFGIAMSILGLVAAVCFWLAFLPPRRFHRWLARRAEARTDGA